MTKPTVHYDIARSVTELVEVGGRAWLCVLDHPEFPPEAQILTSVVLNKNSVTGVIETRNTVYVPTYEEKED